MNNINIVLLELSYRLQYQPEVQFTVEEDCNHKGGIFRGNVSEMDAWGRLSVDYVYNGHTYEYDFNPKYDKNFKLILRSLYDMTEEEHIELEELVAFYMDDILLDEAYESDAEWCLYDKTGIKNLTGGAKFYWEEMIPIYDWFHTKGFDYRGLIEKGIVIKK
jgi:hypothetical protein